MTELTLFQAILDSNPVNNTTLKPTTGIRQFRFIIESPHSHFLIDLMSWNALLESTLTVNLTPEYIQPARSAGSFPIIFNVQI
jgi:hypothetical protein